MKTKITVLILALATCGVAAWAQDSNPNPPAPPAQSDPSPPAPKPDTPPAEETEPAAPPTPDTPPPDPNAPQAVPPATKEVPNAPQAQPEAPASTPVGQTPVVQPEPAQPAGGAADAAANPAETVPLIVIDDVPLTDAIRNLARQSNLNFQFDPKITASNQPNISIRFENVTPQEALTAVLENYNMTLAKDPKSKIARVTVKDPKAEEPLVAKIIQLKYSDPTNVITLLKATLSPRSQAVADPRTSQIIVTTTEKELDALMATIEKIDTPTRQVLIEARLLETAKNPFTIKGINWAGTVEAQRFSFGNNQYVPDSSVSVNQLVTTEAPRILADTARGFNPATAFLNADGVSAVISFLNKDNESEVIATPRAVTLDNQTAMLSVTRAFPIFTITPGSANSPAGAQITYTNLGTILHVTPRIAADNNISLRVLPEVSNVDGQDTQVINNTVNRANIYAIRRIETHVMIPSGNTLVMGGLVNDNNNKIYNKVPVLGDVPGLGWAFRYSSKERKKQNLMIFVTPTIVNDEAFSVSSSGEEFLKTRFVEKAEKDWSAWDSAKPHDWTKPVY